MKVYVVTGNTYNNGYGSRISLFGVFTDKNKAANRASKLKELRGYNTQISEIWIDRNCEQYLGGYSE